MSPVSSSALLGSQPEASARVTSSTVAEPEASFASRASSHSNCVSSVLAQADLPSITLSRRLTEVSAGVQKTLKLLWALPSQAGPINDCAKHKYAAQTHPAVRHERLQ